MQLFNEIIVQGDKGMYGFQKFTKDLEIFERNKLCFCCPQEKTREDNQNLAQED